MPVFSADLCTQSLLRPPGLVQLQLPAGGRLLQDAQVSAHCGRRGIEQWAVLVVCVWDEMEMRGRLVDIEKGC